MHVKSELKLRFFGFSVIMSAVAIVLYSAVASLAVAAPVTCDLL